MTSLLNLGRDTPTPVRAMPPDGTTYDHLDVKEIQEYDHLEIENDIGELQKFWPTLHHAVILIPYAQISYC